MILTLIVANSSVLAGKPTYSKDWREWGEMPSDSIQEDQLRIWLANESTQTMRFRIDILDRSGKVIRQSSIPASARLLRNSPADSSSPDPQTPSWYPSSQIRSQDE